LLGHQRAYVRYGGVAAAADLIDCGTAERVLDDHDASLGKAERVGDGVRERVERCRGDHHRGDAAALELDEVVDTPRRARPSIG
jgi:hypothetical protein